jgi:hypothetical protein
VNKFLPRSVLKLKLFDMLIRPICTYGSEIWISDFTLKDFCIDKLPFEKIHNKFCKNPLQATYQREVVLVY